MLYHFSEEPEIRVFEPRVSRVEPNLRVVWAIDGPHAVHYYFPRDCPRVIVTRTEQANPEDAAKLFAYTEADKIITVEQRWLDRIRTVKLYRYTFEPEGFELNSASAGYYVSRSSVRPVSVELMDDLLARIAETGTELRFVPSLHPFREAVIRSSLDFSVIRYRNAAPRAESGFLRN